MKMSSKKMHTDGAEPEQRHEKFNEQAAAAAAEASVQGFQDNGALSVLESQLAEAQSQAAEYKDGWQRAVAEFQNYRRRVDADKAETYQTAVGSIIKRYLPVLDDMERALQARPADLAWAEGVELICRKLQSILEAEGLKRIEAEGQKFDPNFHEAISQEPKEGVESGTVIDVVRNGYMLGERVIRPAMVRVAQ
jgi:molecular chaperone GrpE